jgi:predicted small lipoprotein YifL
LAVKLRGLSLGLALAALVVVALALGACGRKGELEMPPGPATQPPVAAAPPSPSMYLPGSPGAPPTPEQQDAAAARTGFDAQGNPVATPSAKRSFFLDPLLR